MQLLLRFPRTDLCELVELSSGEGIEMAGSSVVTQERYSA